MDVDNGIKFPERGVIVYLTKADKEDGICVVEKDLGSKEAYLNTVGGDKVIRPVINIALYYKDNPGEYIKILPRSVKISVAYKQSDVDEVGNDKDKLKLNWLKEGVWKPFTREDDGFDFEELPTILWAGWGTAKIKEWGDPPVAWGT